MLNSVLLYCKLNLFVKCNKDVTYIENDNPDILDNEYYAGISKPSPEPELVAWELIVSR